MPSLVDRVLPYFNAAIEEATGPSLQLSADDSPVLEPYIGKLLLAYVVDEGASFRLVSERERRASGISAEMLREAARTNLARKIEASGVRLAPHGNIVAVLFDGNFEATLLLAESFWALVHARLGPELIGGRPRARRPRGRNACRTRRAVRRHHAGLARWRPPSHARHLPAHEQRLVSSRPGLTDRRRTRLACEPRTWTPVPTVT